MPPGEKMTSTPSTIHSCCAVCNYSTLLVSVRLLIIWLTSHKKAIEKIIDFTWDYYIANPWFFKKLCIVKIKVKVCIMQNHSVS